MQAAVLPQLMLAVPCLLHEGALKTPLAAYPSPLQGGSPEMRLANPATHLGSLLIYPVNLVGDGCEELLQIRRLQG